RPVTDDAPFFWHFVGFKNAMGRLRDSDAAARLEEASGERLLMLFLVVAMVFAVVALLLPLAWRRALCRDVPGKGWAGVCFAAIGMGFMFIAIALIQRLTLFLCYPTCSLTVTLFALLIATGVGSLLSERYGPRNRALMRLAVALGALV